jgi:hypothetical protein
MYSLMRLLPLRRLLLEQVPALTTAFLIAEVFYKFKSFALECVAFLATWFVVDVLIQQVARALAAPAARPDPRPRA